jgi:hypothetical protein
MPCPLSAATISTGRESSTACGSKNARFSHGPWNHSDAAWCILYGESLMKYATRRLNGSAVRGWLPADSGGLGSRAGACAGGGRRPGARRCTALALACVCCWSCWSCWVRLLELLGRAGSFSCWRCGLTRRLLQRDVLYIPTAVLILGGSIRAHMLTHARFHDSKPRWTKVF